ncbi:HAD family hydrolase [Pontibacillus salicampi]|uniref:HAD family hydrolase n=1 Tax=Pontibacillus salicampi TaxID=1449801 RepID=A0ABV6LMR3_9BACI
MNHPFIDSSRMLIFDLDGTLYEDTKHFDLFAKKLQSKLSEPAKTHFQKDYQLVQTGKHPLSIGKVYDAKEDVIWEWDPFTETLTNPLLWDGSVPEKNPYQSTSFSAADFDLKRWISIGDGWWPPYVLAIHYGLAITDCHASYDETKVDMASGEGWLTKTPGLASQLLQLKQTKTLVLMTNSERSDVERLLAYLGLENLFDSMVTSAMKPVRTKEHFSQLLTTNNMNPDETVSIGDNFMNEIAPALQNEMKAIWLTPDKAPLSHSKLLAVTSLTEIIPSKS